MSHVLHSQPGGSRDTEAAPRQLAGLTVRAVLIAIVLTIVSFIGVNRLGYIRINWLPYIVPPVQAILFLLVLQGLNVVLRAANRGRRLPAFLAPLSRAELLLIYAGMAVGITMDRAGYVFHYLLFPAYYGDDTNGFAELFQYYPDFYAPHQQWAIKGFFEGTSSGMIPWAVWWRPLLWWGAFNTLLIFAVLALVGMFRHQWAESERLTYPMLYLPLEITGGSEASARVSFFRNPIMWIGFGVAALFNIINITHAFVPAFPEIPRIFRLLSSVHEGPLRYLRPLNWYNALEVWGLSYLVSGEVLGSTLFFYFLWKIVKVVGRQAGYQGAGFPFWHETSAGACIAFTGFMIYAARGHFKRLLGNVINGPDDYDRNEAFSYRIQAAGFVIATAGMIWMMTWAGHRADLLVYYFVSLYMFVLVAARIRAEAGPPVQWCHPYGFDTRVPEQILGTKFLRGYGTPGSMVLYYSLFWIGRTVFAHTAGQAMTDGLRVVDHGPARRRSAAVIILIICVVGMAMAFWYHLDVGYKYGHGLIGAKTGRAGRAWGLNWSRGNYRLLSRALDNPQGPDYTRLGFYGAGFLITLITTWLRMSISNFPLHPLGVILGTLYRDGSPYWAPFLVAWLAQRLTLRYGSLPAYRRVVPAFIGLFFGHVLIGGIIWRLIINYFLDPTVCVRYYVSLGL
ncbi:MAG: hypothetical protein J7M38_00275 [Armatimonadetes bacterium]|nr:hypothetical protein [Armatimonadota bacterium]